MVHCVEGEAVWRRREEKESDRMHRVAHYVESLSVEEMLNMVCVCMVMMMMRMVMMMSEEERMKERRRV